MGVTQVHRHPCLGNDAGCDGEPISNLAQEREFLSFNLLFETRTRIFLTQFRASRREPEFVFVFSISGFETRKGTQIGTILAILAISEITFVACSLTNF